VTESIRILTLNVESIQINEALQRVISWADSANGHSICLANVHMAMEAFDDQVFSNIVNDADMIIPDGKPLVVAQKLLGNPSAEQIRGLDFVHALCILSEQTGLKIGLYGGRDSGLVALVKSRLESIYPSLNIPYLHSPPFRPLTVTEDEKVVMAINTSEVDILFVGIGCPKQEAWMAEHKHNLSCVMVGVGAVFDFLAGEKKVAPKWMQAVGLEWMFRLLSEPSRLWKRYLKQNPRFVWFFLQQRILGKSW
jgi:N-acetylglucosaminyldiphosphoundecaprenol N-acetyl-beta-D-mannosaminyltransferase